MIAMSPDRTTIATVETNDNGGPSHVCAIPLPSGPKTCYPPAATEARPAFGTGAAVYYGAPDGVRRYDPARDEDTLVVPGGPIVGGIAVAPDGGVLVYSTCRSYAHVIDANDFTQPAVVLADDDQAFQPALASTGAMAWTRDVDTVNVLIYRDPAGGLHPLTDATSGSIRAPRFDPAGKKIVFARTGALAGLYYVNVDTPGVLHQITRDATATNPVWTAGNRIVFHRADTHGNAHAFSVSLAGDDITPLGDTTRYVYAVRGDEVLVGDETLEWVDARTGKGRPGPNPDGDVPYWASVSPDGRWLAIQTTALLGVIYRMRLDQDDVPHLVKRYGGGTTVSHVSIDDTGHIIETPQTWHGDLFVVPARAGSHF